MTDASLDIWVKARSKYKPICGLDVVWFAHSGFVRLARRLAITVIGEGA